MLLCYVLSCCRLFRLGLGSIFVRFGGVLGRFLVVLGGLRGVLGGVLEVLRGLGRLLGGSWGGLGHILGRLGSSWAAMGRLGSFLSQQGPTHTLLWGGQGGPR